MRCERRAGIDIGAEVDPSLAWLGDLARDHHVVVEAASAAVKVIRCVQCFSDMLCRFPSWAEA